MMEKATGFPYPRSVFAGSNTADGFVSQFDSLLRGCLRVYILKGSPGSGKSTLLRAVAARARAEGEPYTEIICSADTNSLDGVILHGRRTAVIDGTAPHAAEAVYPGARERILNLGDCLDTHALFEKREEIITLVSKKSRRYKNAYALLNAANTLRGAAIANLSDALLAGKLQAFAARFCRRLPKDGAPFELLWPRYARTADGEVELDVFDPVERYSIIDAFGEGFLLTEALAQQARAESVSFVVTPDALNARKIRSLYFPAAGVLVTVGEGEGKRINMKRFIDPEKERETRRLNRLFRKGSRLLLDDAAEAFESARTLHFELEDIYVAAMDCEKAGRLRDALINEIF